MVIALTTELICCPAYRNNAMVLISDPFLDVPGISLYELRRKLTSGKYQERRRSWIAGVADD
jgi:hypothetical protein